MDGEFATKCACRTMRSEISNRSCANASIWDVSRWELWEMARKLPERCQARVRYQAHRVPYETPPPYLRPQSPMAVITLRRCTEAEPCR